MGRWWCDWWRIVIAHNWSRKPISVFASNLSQINRQVLSLVIEYDVNGNGKLDFDEFMEMMRKQVDILQNFTTWTFVRLSPGRTPGQLCRVERSIQNIWQVGSWQVDKRSESFSYFRDGNGFIDAAELKKVTKIVMHYIQAQFKPAQACKTFPNTLPHVLKRKNSLWALQTRPNKVKLTISGRGHQPKGPKRWRWSQGRKFAPFPTAGWAGWAPVSFQERQHCAKKDEPRTRRALGALNMMCYSVRGSLEGKQGWGQ